MLLYFTLGEHQKELVQFSCFIIGVADHDDDDGGGWRWYRFMLCSLTRSLLKAFNREETSVVLMQCVCESLRVGCSVKRVWMVVATL